MRETDGLWRYVVPDEKIKLYRYLIQTCVIIRRRGNPSF